MKLKAFKLGGFRNIQDTVIEMDEICALAAANGFGKTSVFDGLLFALRFIQAEQKEKEYLLKTRNNIPFHPAGRNDNFLFELEIQTQFQNQPVQAVYGFEAKWQSDAEDTPAVIREFLKFKEIGPSDSWTTAMERNGLQARYKKSQTERRFSLMPIEPASLVFNKLAWMDEFFCQELAWQILTLRFASLQNSSLSLWRRNPLSDESQLPKLLFEIKEQGDGTWELLVDMMQSLFPALDSLIVKKADIHGFDPATVSDTILLALREERYALYYQERSIPGIVLPFSMMSGGMKKILHLLAAAAAAASSQYVCLILLEELENSIHPSLYSPLLQMISELAQDCQILISTHSPQLMECIGLDHLYLGCSSTPGLASFKKLSLKGQRQLIQECQELDTSVGQEVLCLLESGQTLKPYLQN